MKDLRVKKSKIHGLGLFSKKPKKKGTRISFLKGNVCKKHNSSIRDALSHSCWIGIGRDTWIDPSYPYRYINHSCNPSTSIKGRVTLVALRDLKPNDEITLDYSLLEADSRWHMNCKCKETNCRKTIRAIGFLPKKIFKGYLPFVPTYFKDLYLNNRGHSRGL